VIRHRFHFDNFAPTFGTNFTNDLFQTSLYISDKYVASVLWAPNDVIFTGISDVIVRFNLHTQDYTDRSCIVNPKGSGRQADIPIAKARGITPDAVSRAEGPITTAG
jgi:hypothetical protein